MAYVFPVMADSRQRGTGDRMGCSATARGNSMGIPLVIDGDESVRACAADVACLAGCPYSACRVGYRRRA